MAINSYPYGSLVRCSGDFVVGTNPTDPTTVNFLVKDPTGAVTTYVYNTNDQVVRDGTGDYHVDVMVQKSGTWYYRFEGTGTCVAANEQYFYVETTEFH